MVICVCVLIYKGDYVGKWRVQYHWKGSLMLQLFSWK